MTEKVKSDIVIESATPKGIELLIKAGAKIVEATLSYKEAHDRKLSVLSDKLHVKSWQYNETILKHYVNRKIYFYNTGKKTNIWKIRHEITRPRLSRNIIITGPGGSGKSTTLKWLYLNTTVKGFSYTYLSANMFSKYSNFDQALSAMESFIDHFGSSVVFIDGLDEFACINSQSADFNKLVSFIDRKSSVQQSTPHHRFVISTRPEHFEFQAMIVNKNTQMNLDNYCVFELRDLEPKETIKICKTVKYLSKLGQHRTENE